MKIEAKIQKWGNGLALRISGIMRDIPHFQEGTPIEVEVNEDGLTIKKIHKKKRTILPYTEEELLADMNPENAGKDLLAKPLDKEF